MSKPRTSAGRATKKAGELRATELRHKLFAEHWVRHQNAKQAAIHAGYSAASAGPAGSRLLAHVNVQRLIAELESDRRNRMLTSDREIEEGLRALAFSRITDLARWDADKVQLTASEMLSDAAIAAVSEVRMGKEGPIVKMAGKEGALRQLAEMRGLLKEQTSGTLTINVNVRRVKPDAIR